jgi:hypothetical protein
MGSISVPLAYQSCPLPLDHGYHEIYMLKIYKDIGEIGDRREASANGDG